MTHTVVFFQVQQQALSEQCAKLEKEASNKHWLLRGFICLLGLLLIAFVAIIVIVALILQPKSCADKLTSINTGDFLIVLCYVLLLFDANDYTLAAGDCLAHQHNPLVAILANVSFRNIS